MTRLSIDWDGEGAFAVITRPGQAAERIPLTHRDAVRLMSEAAQAVLMEGGRRQMSLVQTEGHSNDTPHFIGVLGE